MSDDEDVLEGSDDDLDETEETGSSRGRETKRSRVNEDEEDEKDEEDESDDELDETRGRAQKKPRQHTGKKTSVSNFFDDAAIDSDSEGFEDDSDDSDKEDFRDLITEELGDPVDEVDEGRSRSRYRRKMRENYDDDDIATLAESFKKRVERDYDDDEQVITQELLLPNKNDPKLFLVQVLGHNKEQNVVIAVTHKWKNSQARRDEDRVKITGAMMRPDLPGFVYIEAENKSAVEQALQNVPDVDTRTIKLVPLDEMQDCVKPIATKTLQKGEFVRIKRGIYREDVAQVMSFDQSSNKAELKLLPRLDYERMKVEKATREIERGRRQELKGNYVAPPKIKAGARAPRRKFSRVDAEHALGRDEIVETHDGKVKLRSKGDVYTASGFLLKKFPVTSLQTKDVMPSADDKLLFSQDDDVSSRVALIKPTKKIVFSHGDTVELVQGDLQGLQGTVVRIVDDSIYLRVKDFDELLEVDASQLIKSFSMGAHVKVIGGYYEGETGLIVRIVGQEAHLLTDVTRQQIHVLCQDLQTAAEVAVSIPRLNGYELNDLVLLPHSGTAGMIIKINRDSFQILDGNGQVHSNVPTTDLGRRLLNRDTSTYDRQNSSVRIGDSIQVVDGPHNRKFGTVLQIWKSSVFIRCRDALETCGIIVARGNCCTVSGSSTASKPSLPALPPPSPRGGNRGAFGYPAGPGGGFGRGAAGGGSGVSSNVGKTVRISRGPWKGYVGRVKDEMGMVVRIELQANCKVVTVGHNEFKVGEPQASAASSTSTSMYGSSALPPQTPSHAAPNTPMHTTGFETPSRTPDTTWYNNEDDHYSTSTVQTPGLSANQSWSNNWSSGGYLPNYGSGTGAVSTPYSTVATPYSTVATPYATVAAAYSTYSSPAVPVPATPHFGGVMTPTVVPATPHFGGVMTPAFPATPSLLPTTPATGLAHAPLSSQPAHWVQEDLVVQIDAGEAQGRQGVVLSADPAGMNIQVFVDSLGKTVAVQSADVKPATAVRGDKVVLLGGTDRGMTGTLDSVITVSGGLPQGAVKLHAVHKVTVVPLSELAPMKKS